MEARMRPPWVWPALAAAALAVLLAPFFVVDVPAVLDYPNHLARFYFLAHPHDPWLSRFYAPHWTVLPNLGLDVIGAALAAVAPVHVAGRVVLALSLVAPAAGTAVYARAAFGRWTWWSLGAAVIAFNGVFFMGFMNFLLSIGMALACAGAWRVLSRRARVFVLAAAGAVMGAAVFACHLVGFAFFGLLIGSQEAADAYDARATGGLAPRRLAGRAAALAAALGPPLVVFIATHHASGAENPLRWNWSAKAAEWLLPFMTYDRPLTAATAIVLLVAAGCIWRDAARASGAGLALAVLVAAFLAGPFALDSGTFFDARMPVMAAFLLFAALAPRASRGTGLLIAAAFAALLVIRAAEVTANWRGRAADLADLRRTIALVEPGAAVLAAETKIDLLDPGHGRALQGFMRLDRHLPALLLIERHAFWPLLFSHPAQQPLRTRPPYDRMSAMSGEPVAWRALLAPAPGPADLVNYPYLPDWRRRFDYVLVVGPPPQTLPAGLSLLRAGPQASLYRVDR